MARTRADQLVEDHSLTPEEERSWWKLANGGKITLLKALVEPNTNDVDAWIKDTASHRLPEQPRSVAAVRAFLLKQRQTLLFRSVAILDRLQREKNQRATEAEDALEQIKLQFEALRTKNGF